MINTPVSRSVSRKYAIYHIIFCAIYFVKQSGRYFSAHFASVFIYAAPYSDNTFTIEEEGGISPYSRLIVSSASLYVKSIALLKTGLISEVALSIAYSISFVSSFGITFRQLFEIIHIYHRKSLYLLNCQFSQ